MFVFDCADWPFVDLSVNANQTDAMSHRKWYGEKIVRNRRIWYPLLHIWAKRRYESLISRKTVIGWNYLCIIKVALCCAQKDYIQEGLFPIQGSNIHGLRGCVLLIFFHICHNNLILPGVKWNPAKHIHKNIIDCCRHYRYTTDIQCMQGMHRTFLSTSTT